MQADNWGPKDSEEHVNRNIKTKSKEFIIHTKSRKAGGHLDGNQFKAVLTKDKEIGEMLN